MFSSDVAVIYYPHMAKGNHRDKKEVKKPKKVKPKI